MCVGPSPLKAGALAAGFALLLALSALLPTTAHAAESGSGAETGAGEALEAGAARQEAGTYYAELAKMLGRLQAGHELYRIGDRADGGRQFTALGEQHLPVVREALAAHDLDLLIRRIEKLSEEAARSDSWLDVQDLHEASRMSLQRALAQVEPSTREDPAFKAEIAARLAREAVQGYELSIEDGEFARPGAYQTGYGYIRYGHTLLERNAGLLEQAGDKLHDSLVDQYEALMEAWPSLRLPPEPPISPKDLRDRLAALESTAERF